MYVFIKNIPVCIHPPAFAVVAVFAYSQPITLKFVVLFPEKFDRLFGEHISLHSIWFEVLMNEFTLNCIFFFFEL